MLIGIDLGTTNSLVACFRNGRAEIIPNRLGEHLTPSVVSIDSDGTVYVGRSAKERAIVHPMESAAVFKRGMGTDREYVLGERHLRAEELSSLILRSLKEDAEHYLGETITEAIISVPAYFNDHQRKATVRAGEMAGLNVSRIINEPTAAAIAHGITEKQDARYLVFDLGGGTFDVSVLELYDSIMEVHAIAGDNFIGGEDFTELLYRLFLKHTGVDPNSLDLQMEAELRRTAESCKCAFSHNEEIFMCCSINGQLHGMRLTLEEYERACEPLLERLRRPLERSLKDARVTLEEIDRIVPVGGATRLPVVQRFLAKLFKRMPEPGLDPDEAVAIGAALQCGLKSRDKELREVVLTDVCPFTLGTEIVMDNGYFEESGHYLPIIERNTIIPVSRTETVYTAHDDQTRVNVRILQGESRMAQNNVLLGELSVPVPPGPKGRESLDITYTYDVNALLEVDVLVRSTGFRRKLLIRSSRSPLSQEEAEERMKLLQYLKLNPRDEEPNRLLLLRGERLYEEAMSETRAWLDHAITEFEQVLKKKDRLQIQRAREKLKDILDEIEYGSN